MARVTKEKQNEVIRELEQDLEDVCKNFVYAREHKIDASTDTIIYIRMLSEELLRWRIL